jgi:hypothetical protein
MNALGDPSSSYPTFPTYTQETCAAAGGLVVQKTDANGTTSSVCDVTPLTKRPSWSLLGLSVLGALAVGAGLMHLSMKDEKRR